MQIQNKTTKEIFSVVGTQRDGSDLIVKLANGEEVTFVFGERGFESDKYLFV